MHSNDIEALKFIKAKLSSIAGREAGSVTLNQKSNSAEFCISTFYLIEHLILPIFNLYPLRTVKYLDFSQDWKSSFDYGGREIHQILFSRGKF